MARRAWYLTDRADEAARASIAAFEGVFHDPVVRALAVGRGLEGPELPPAADARAVHLKDQLPSNFAWPGKRTEESPQPETAGDSVLLLIATVLFLSALVVGLFQIGKVIIEWIVGLFGG